MVKVKSDGSNPLGVSADIGPFMWITIIKRWKERVRVGVEEIEEEIQRSAALEDPQVLQGEAIERGQRGEEVRAIHSSKGSDVWTYIYMQWSLLWLEKTIREDLWSF
jgi:hypothetical protein